jgi:hypothetical protein
VFGGEELAAAWLEKLDGFALEGEFQGDHEVAGDE